MITDRREILFDAEALLTVLAGSPRAATALGLPPGAPQAVLFDPKAEAVRFIWSHNSKRQADSVDSTRLGALLVGFCLRLRVPLPRRAEKGIRVEAGLVVLTFVMPIKADLLSLTAEGRLPEGSTPPSERNWAAT